MKKNILPHLALLGTNLFFGINLSAAKYLIDNGLVKAFGLNLIRIGVTALLLWVVGLFRNRALKIKKKDFLRFVLCAVTGIVINQLLFIKGLSLTFSIHAGLLMLITPILISIIAAWILKEKLSSNKMLGLGLGFVGAAVLIGSKAQSGDSTNMVLGDFLIIINAISYTIYFILVKPLMERYRPVDVIKIIFTMGLVLAMPFCWTEFKTTAWDQFTTTSWILLLLVVFCGTFLAYLFNIYGIKKLGASVAGAYIYSQPAFATIIAVIFLNEEIEIYKIIAAIFIFSGVYLANRKQHR
ncbi:MAG: DMT family transporter [Ferruginibacter sp.]|nr:DMT family transporter [Ferruginibacter sp.]